MIFKLNCKANISTKYPLHKDWHKLKLVNHSRHSTIRHKVEVILLAVLNLRINLIPSVYVKEVLFLWMLITKDYNIIHMHCHWATYRNSYKFSHLGTMSVYHRKGMGLFKKINRKPAVVTNAGNHSILCVWGKGIKCTP